LNVAVSVNEPAAYGRYMDGLNIAARIAQVKANHIIANNIKSSIPRII
jgi:hypothetical protein